MMNNFNILCKRRYLLSFMPKKILDHDLYGSKFVVSVAHQSFNYSFDRNDWLVAECVRLT